MVSDDKDQHVKVDAGKKRDVSEEDMMKTFEKRYPPGLWCGKKRQAFGPNENKATEVAEGKQNGRAVREALSTWIVVWKARVIQSKTYQYCKNRR